MSGRERKLNIRCVMRGTDKLHFYVMTRGYRIRRSWLLIYDPIFVMNVMVVVMWFSASFLLDTKCVTKFPVNEFE